MKKIILLGMVCVLSMVGSVCYAQGYIVPKDIQGTPLEQPEIPMGKPAEVISTNSGAFQLNTTAYRLCIAVNGVQNTVTLATVSSTIPIAVKFAGDIVKSINDYNVPYLKAMVYGDVAKKAKVRIVVYGNTANLQIIANSTGAETILGLSTTLVYATPPNFAPTVGGSPVSSANPMPVSGITSQSDTNVYVTNFPTDYKQSNTDVLIVGSLPAGTNSIGDIGTVSTVSSLTTGTVDIGKVDEISNITSVDLVDLITRITALESATIKYMPPVTATDLDIRDLGAGDTVGARQHGSWTVNNPSDVKVYAFTFYDTTASGTVTFTGVLKNIGITSGGAVTDSATIFINGVQYDCLLGGEDSGEGLEGYLLNPVIRWELYGVTRMRIKLSGYTP